jgi:hypothetical protein
MTVLVHPCRLERTEAFMRAHGGAGPLSVAPEHAARQAGQHLRTCVSALDTLAGASDHGTGSALLRDRLAQRSPRSTCVHMDTNGTAGSGSQGTLQRHAGSAQLINGFADLRSAAQVLALSLPRLAD